MRFLFTVLLLLSGSFFPSLAGVDSRSAEQLFAEGLNLQDMDLGRARGLFAEAARAFELEAGQETAVRGPWLYNAGNAWYLAGEPGRALLAYLRAEKQLPGHPWLEANLEFLRRQHGSTEPDAPVWPARLSSILKDFAVDGWLLLAGLYLVACTWLGLHFWWPERFRLTWFWAGAGVALLLLAGLLCAEATSRFDRRGVVVAEQVTLRKGPGYGYLPVLDTPLQAGSEARLLREERGWKPLEGSADWSGWVPEATFERVQAAR